MRQSLNLLLIFTCLLFNFSLQSQLIRDLAGSTTQNLQAQASQWTLGDPLGLEYPINIIECIQDKIIVKPDSLLPGASLKKTFNDLEDHNLLRFYVQMYYMGDYSSQSVSIKFDDITIETSQLLPMMPQTPYDYCSGGYVLSGYMVYYGAVPHAASSVTVEFVSNLNGAIMDISWGLRNFSLVTDTSDPVISPYIYGASNYQPPTIPAYPCSTANFPLEMDGLPPLCVPCMFPCQECYGMNPDQCFTYLPLFPENRLCPLGQTFTLSGCTPCVVENCDSCDEDVNQCDSCQNFCSDCMVDWNGNFQCRGCTVESGLVFYEGTCIENCPQGMYADFGMCQNCRTGCLECSGLDQCTQCASSDLTTVDGVCMCNQHGTYFEQESGGCTGTCSLGCEQCINGQECRICHSGTTFQPDRSCQCDNPGSFYQEETGSCTGQCPEFCDSCLDSSSCLSCSGNREAQGGICKCQSPRVLIGNNCECPAYMAENPLTLNCENIPLIEILYQPKVSPLYDAVLKIRVNPLTIWTPSTFSWMVFCNFQNPDTSFEFMDYMTTQNSDLVVIPSRFLEYDLQCDLNLVYSDGMLPQFLPPITLETISSSQPNVNILGGPLQMFSHKELNFIFAEVKSSTGKVLSASDVKITWTQTGGDTLNMKKIYSSSNPFQLTIPKCTLSKGKTYKFKLTVKLLSNNQEASHEVTIGVYAPKFKTQVADSAVQNYHILTKSLTLKPQLSLEEDECGSKNSLSNLLDLSTAMYTWECAAVNLQLSSSTRLLEESNEIIDDPDVSPHSDPSKLFYQSASSSSLTIPSSYFTQYKNYQFIFYLTVTIKSKNPATTLTDFQVQRPSLEVLKTKTSFAIVTSKPLTTMSFTCISENDCQAYSEELPTKFIGNSYNYKYSYEWLLNNLKGRQYTTFFTVSYTGPDKSIVNRFVWTASDGTNVASAFMTIPWNFPPENGIVSVSPTEGEAYNTKFFITTSGWTDADLPLTYQFYTSNDANTYPIPRKLMTKTLNPFDYTPLIPSPWYSNYYVGVLVQDSLKAVAEPTPVYVSLSGAPEDLCQALTKSSKALTASKKSDNLLSRFKLISAILENLERWENSDSPCLTDDYYTFKFTAVTQLKDIVKALNLQEELKVQMLENIIYSSFPEYNQDKNWNLYNEIVDSYYLKDLSTAVLPESEYTPLFTFVDYQIWYMKKPNATILDIDKVFDYMNMLLRSTLADAIPTDWGVNYAGSWYTYFTYKTTYCKVLDDHPSFRYGFYGLVANVTLKPGKTIPKEKCNDLIDMVFLSFRSNYTLNVEIRPEDSIQNIIYSDLIDSVTGKSLVKDLYTFVLASSVSTCPPDYACSPTLEGGTQIYGVFDLKNQVNKIFLKSSFDEIQNIEALAHFKFWQSAAFWTVVALSVWFLISIYKLLTKHRNYCALTANKDTISQKPLIKKVSLFFWVIHPVVGIYIFNDPKTPKPIKLAIFYQRLVVVTVFSSIFSSLDTGEGFVFKAYILLFTTITVTPINAILSRAFEWIFSTHIDGKKVTSRIALWTGIFSYVSLLLGCFIILFIIEAQKEASENREWAINFAIAFVQDLSLSPAITTASTVFFIKLFENERFAKSINPKVKGALLSDSFKAIYYTIFVATPAAPAKLDSFTPRTSIFNPTSTSRKLLRFSSMDLAPPSLKNQISSPPLSEMRSRSRRASESEIGTVDLAATEILFSNRFQILHPEAKPEDVKQFNQIKQNYQKMQTSNLYSKQNKQPFNKMAEFNSHENAAGISLEEIFTYIDNPDETNPSQFKMDSSPVRQKKRHLTNPQARSGNNTMLKNILKPSEGAAVTKGFNSMELNSSLHQGKEQSEHEVSSFDGNVEDTFASQPKLWKDGKTMESPKRQSLMKNNEHMSAESPPSRNQKALNLLKQNEKPAPSLEFSSMFQLKEQSEINLQEVSSFGGNEDEMYPSQPKLWTKGKIMKSSPMGKEKKNKKNKAEKYEDAV